MIRKTKTLPVKEREVEYVRYTGNNLSEITNFANSHKTGYEQKERFYLSIGDDKELYWKGHGFIRTGDFVVYGMPMNYHMNTTPDGFAIVSWKEFPRIVQEDIPVFMDEYMKYISEPKNDEQKTQDGKGRDE